MTAESATHDQQATYGFCGISIILICRCEVQVFAMACSKFDGVHNASQIRTCLTNVIMFIDQWLIDRCQKVL